MQVIGLSDYEQSEIFRMLAVILWLGNVQYNEMDDGNAGIADTSVSDFVAYLLEVDPAQVQKALTTRTMETQRGGRDEFGRTSNRHARRPSIESARNRARSDAEGSQTKQTVSQFDPGHNIKQNARRART